MIASGQQLQQQAAAAAGASDLARVVVCFVAAVLLIVVLNRDGSDLTAPFCSSSHQLPTCLPLLAGWVAGGSAAACRVFLLGG